MHIFLTSLHVFNALTFLLLLPLPFCSLLCIIFSDMPKASSSGSGAYPIVSPSEHAWCNKARSLVGMRVYATMDGMVYKKLVI